MGSHVQLGYRGLWVCHHVDYKKHIYCSTDRVNEYSSHSVNEWKGFVASLGVRGNRLGRESVLHAFKDFMSIFIDVTDSFIVSKRWNVASHTAGLLGVGQPRDAHGQRQLLQGDFHVKIKSLVYSCGGSDNTLLFEPGGVSSATVSLSLRGRRKCATYYLAICLDRCDIRGF